METKNYGYCTTPNGCKIAIVEGTKVTAPDGRLCQLLELETGAFILSIENPEDSGSPTSLLHLERGSLSVVATALMEHLSLQPSLTTLIPDTMNMCDVYVESTLYEPENEEEDGK